MPTDAHSSLKSLKKTLSTPPLKTPLYEEHLQAGAKMIDFGGWLMPVQYRGIMDEHRAVRNALGVFDISHMGQIAASGPGAEHWLNELLTNNVSRLEPGEGQYTFLLNERGGVIDDLILYRTGPESFLLVVNAAKIEEDFSWMGRRNPAGGVVLENRSDACAGLAVQGPRSARLFDKFFEGKHSRPARNTIKTIRVGPIDLMIARTGYTGEDGFELFFPSECAAKIWREVLDAGAEFEIQPCGLGARDTLRLEMCYPLNGSDLSPERTPLEAGLSIFVDLQKPAFVGRDALVAQKAAGVKERLVPFRMREKSPPPRAHYPVLKEGRVVAETTSGSLSPTLGFGIGMAYVPTAIARANEEIEIDIRGRRYAATIEKKPLYRKA